MSEWSMPGVEEWTLPGYTEERLLGRGVSGRVVTAVEDASGRRVAIKYLDDDIAIGDPAFLRRYRGEFDRLKPVDSPHVVPLIDYIELSGLSSAIVMGLVEGVSLREVIASGGPLGPEAALVVLKDSLLGLEAAHQVGVPHRDLKPENVLIDALGQCTLTDFGIAAKSNRRTPAGTPAYMAPELWGGTSNGSTTDVYAATAVLWESVTGKPPFSGRLAQLRRQHKSAAVPIERFDQPLQGLIASGMAKNPADRPQSPRAFADDLEARATAAYGTDWESDGRHELGERVGALLPLLLEGNGGSSAAATKEARRKRRNLVLVGTTATAALVALAALVLSGMSGKAEQASLAAAVTTAQAIVTPPVVASTCATATTFTYSGTITTTAPGKVSYRWLYSSGKQGPAQTLRFTAAGSQQVSGGTVAVPKAGEGWARLSLLSGAAATSNKATYQLLCTTVPSGLALTASVTPKSQTVYSCAAAPPILSVTGTIAAKKAESVTYYWALADGQKSAPRTIAFKAAGKKTLSALKVTPLTLPAKGEAVLVVTKPIAAASKPATYTVSCLAPVTSVPTAPGQPAVGPTPGGRGSPSSGSGTHPTTAPPTRSSKTPIPTHSATGAPTIVPPSTPAPPTSTSPSAPPTSPSPTTSPSSIAPSTPITGSG